MRKNLKKKLSILLLIICLVMPMAAQNLFTNPSFEQGSTGWQLQTMSGTAGTVNYNSTEAVDGNYGAAFNITTVNGTDWNVQLNTPSDWNAEIGAKYKLSFWAKAAAPVIIHVAIQDGPQNDYAYRTGYNYNLSTTWQRFETYYTSDVAGIGAMRINIFLGNLATTYYMDNFILETEVTTNPGDITLPAQGAYYSGIYRNLFKEMGKSDAEITSKVNQAFNQIFHGNPQNEALYFETGSDMAYIKAIDSDDIRSEGLSYGMMISVQLDKKTEFDKIWKFSKTYAQHQSGPRKGYFAWNVNVNNFAKSDDNSAPDGEEYWVMALLFASHRWGDGTGIFNYSQEAKQILHDMIHLEERNGGVVNGLVNMFNTTEKQIVFVPNGQDATYTDPSYHVPAFYKLWALWADEDKSFWQDVAETSKNFLLQAMHSQTGLVTDYMAFNGQPQQTAFNEMSHRFAYDSWRVGMNIAVDCHWFGNDGWQSQQINKLLGFFTSQGASYLSLYEQNGTPLSSNNSHSEGLVAMNGAAALSATDSIAWNFVQELWEMPIPTGQWRYYNGMLYMLGLLNASANYRIYGPATQPGLRGDVNNDGSINIIDALMIAQYTVGLNPQGFNPDVADVTDDGIVNIVDALKVAQFYVGLIPVL